MFVALNKHRGLACKPGQPRRLLRTLVLRLWFVSSEVQGNKRQIMQQAGPSPSACVWGCPERMDLQLGLSKEWGCPQVGGPRGKVGLGKDMASSSGTSLGHGQGFQALKPPPCQGSLLSGLALHTTCRRAFFNGSS